MSKNIWVCRDRKECPYKCAWAYGIREDHHATLTEFKANSMIYIGMPDTGDMCPFLHDYANMVRYGNILNGRRLS